MLPLLYLLYAKKTSGFLREVSFAAHEIFYAAAAAEVQKVKDWNLLGRKRLKMKRKYV